MPSRSSTLLLLFLLAAAAAAAAPLRLDREAVLALAREQAPAILAARALEGVAEGVAEVQRLANALLKGIVLDNCLFDGNRALDQFACLGLLAWFEAQHLM